MRQVLAVIACLLLMALFGGGGAALAEWGGPPRKKPAPATYMYCGPRIDEQPGYWCVETRKPNYKGGVAAVTILTPTEYGLTGVRTPSR